MRKSIPFTLLLAAIFAAFATPMAAQNIEQELTDLAQKWQSAYNRADQATLATMYTDQVINHNNDGSTSTISKADLEAGFTKDFNANTLHTEVTITRMMVQPGGKVKISGTFATTGSNKKTGEAIKQAGKYEHTAVQEAGVWKLCELNILGN